MTFADARQRPYTFPFFNVAVKNSPMYEKRYKGGEDSYLVSTNRRFIGVADGVGGWANRDVCSGVCAKFLCQTMCDVYNSDNDLSLRELLKHGVKALKEAQIEGSTTVYAAKLEPLSEVNHNQ